MPYIHVYDGNLTNDAVLAGNAGLYEAGRQGLHDSFAADANARANDAAANSGEESQLRAVLGDITHRQLNQANNDRAYGVQGMRDAQGQLIQGMRGDVALAGQANRSAIADANRQSRDGNFAAGLEQRSENDQLRNDTTVRGQDLANGLGYDRLGVTREQMDQSSGIAYDRMQQQREIADERAAAQRLAQSERERAMNQQMSEQERRQRLQMEVGELQRLRAINERRAQRGDGEAGGRIGGINQAIADKMAGAGVGQPQPVAPGNGTQFNGQPFQPMPPVNYGQPAQPAYEPQGQPATQGMMGPQSAAPSHIVIQGVTWVMVGTDPATGEPLYQEGVA